jgi:putative polyhydroxyalkanoate system protein
MSTIDIHAHHHLGRAEAQRAADELSQDLCDKFGVDYGWDGDILHFERPGVQGCITVGEEEIHVEARLGLALALLKAPIENEVRRYLSEHFDCTF